MWKTETVYACCVNIAEKLSIVKHIIACFSMMRRIYSDRLFRILHTRVSTTMAYTTLPLRSNFLGLERSFSEFLSSQIVVVSAPYERTVSYGAGTKRGPHAIIKASHYVELYDEELDRELYKEVGIATLAPMHFGKGSDVQSLHKLRRCVEDLRRMGKFVVTLGGEHTITQATVAAHLTTYPRLSVLQIDAHSDLRTMYQGSKYSHASVMARVCEIVDPARVVQVGIRAQCVEEANFIRNSSIHTVYAHQLRASAGWIDDVVRSLGEEVYVTFDVDGLDPSIMPSTGTPEPNGLYWHETMTLLRRVGEEKKIIGFDVVELAPMKGVPHPDLTTARLTYKLMNYAFRS
jgi:agmatinase